eukprot:15001115-Alexandrium_andersonii.AAC.1
MPSGLGEHQEQQEYASNTSHKGWWDGPYDPEEQWWLRQDSAWQGWGSECHGAESEKGGEWQCGGR